MNVNSALVGKSGELLVAAELMRRGVEVAHPASDVGVDLLAYRLAPRQTVPAKFVPVQVKARAAWGYNFQRDWFDRVPGVVLVQVWHITAKLPEFPQFYVFDNEARVVEALGAHSLTDSWKLKGRYTVTAPGIDAIERMQARRDKWDRIIDQLL